MASVTPTASPSSTASYIPVTNTMTGSSTPTATSTMSAGNSGTAMTTMSPTPTDTVTASISAPATASPRPTDTMTTAASSSAVTTTSSVSTVTVTASASITHTFAPNVVAGDAMPTSAPSPVLVNGILGGIIGLIVIGAAVAFIIQSMRSRRRLKGFSATQFAVSGFAAPPVIVSENADSAVDIKTNYAAQSLRNSITRQQSFAPVMSRRIAYTLP